MFLPEKCKFVCRWCFLGLVLGNIAWIHTFLSGVNLVLLVWSYFTPSCKRSLDLFFSQFYFLKICIQILPLHYHWLYCAINALLSSSSMLSKRFLRSQKKPERKDFVSMRCVKSQLISTPVRKIAIRKAHFITEMLLGTNIINFSVVLLVCAVSGIPFNHCNDSKADISSVTLRQNKWLTLGT